MSSIIKVDTISEKTSAGGVTIDGVLIKDNAIASSYISGLSSGLEAAQQFVQTANVTSTGDITANWAVPNVENQGNLGSLVSESSGIFSFSQTGFYKVTFVATCTVISAGNSYGKFRIYSTDDNSTYNYIAEGFFGGTSDYDIHTLSTSTIIDVTNTTNDKIKFYFAEQTGDTRLQGTASYNRTYVEFLKLGDT